MVSLIHNTIQHSEFDLMLVEYEMGFSDIFHKL